MSKEKWNFDTVHSSINFSVRHLMIAKVHGRFTQWEGVFEWDDAQPTQSRVEVQIAAASIDTKEAQRDGHLRSPDFLDAEKHPHITYRSTAVEAAGDKLYKVRGDLTIRGVTKPVVLEVEYAGRQKDPWGGERIGFTAKTSIERGDYGLKWNQALEAGGVLVGEKVSIDVEVEAVRPKS